MMTAGVVVSNSSTAQIQGRALLRTGERRGGRYLWFNG